MPSPAPVDEQSCVGGADYLVDDRRRCRASARSGRPAAGPLEDRARRAHRHRRSRRRVRRRRRRPDLHRRAARRVHPLLGHAERSVRDVRPPDTGSAVRSSTRRRARARLPSSVPADPWRRRDGRVHRLPGAAPYPPGTASAPVRSLPAGRHHRRDPADVGAAGRRPAPHRAAPRSAAVHQRPGVRVDPPRLDAGAERTRRWSPRPRWTTRTSGSSFDLAVQGFLRIVGAVIVGLGYLIPLTVLGAPRVGGRLALPAPARHRLIRPRAGPRSPARA